MCIIHYDREFRFLWFFSLISFVLCSCTNFDSYFGFSYFCNICAVLYMKISPMWTFLYMIIWFNSQIAVISKSLTGYNGRFYHRGVFTFSIERSITRRYIQSCSCFQHRAVIQVNNSVLELHFRCLDISLG